MPNKVSALLFVLCCLVSYSTVSVAVRPTYIPSTFTMVLADRKYKLVMMESSCEKVGEKEIILSKQEIRSFKAARLYNAFNTCKGWRGGAYSSSRYHNDYKITYSVMRPVIKNPYKNANGIPYPASGLYKNDESTTPLWTMEAIKQGDIHLGRGGNYMAVVTDLGQGMLTYPAIVFYYKGKAFKEYYYQELMSDPGKMMHFTDHGTYWMRKNTFDENSNRLSIITNSNDRLEFDITTGEIIKGPPTQALSIHGQVYIGKNKSISLKNIHMCHGFMEEPILIKQPILEPMLSGFIILSKEAKNISLNKVVRIPLKMIKRIENNSFGNQGDTVLTIFAYRSDETFQINMPNDSELCATGQAGEKVSIKLAKIHSISDMRALKERIKPVAPKYNRPGNEKLLKVYFNNPIKGWAIAMKWGVPIILITKDGGVNWAVQYADTDADFFPLDIKFDKSGRYGWVLGTNQTLLTTNDYGLSWVKSSNIIANTMHYLKRLLNVNQFYDRSLESAFGHDSLDIKYREFDYISPSDKLVSDHTYTQLIFSGNSDVWVIHNGRELLKSTSGGNDWIPVDLPQITYIRQIHFIDSLHGWLLGRDHTSYVVLLFTKDGGEHWRTLRYSDRF